MAKTRRFLLPLLGALLLFAQHVAMTHAVWHQTDAGAGSKSLAERYKPQSDGQKASALCDFDAVLGQLLAGGAVASHASLPARDGALALSFNEPPLATLALVQPRSRGPPLVL